MQSFTIIRNVIICQRMFGQFSTDRFSNQPSQTTYWQTESDALMALTACYDAMQSQNLYDDNIDGWKFGFLGRETSTDNGDHTWGNWMLGSSISQCTSATTDECFSMY